MLQTGRGQYAKEERMPRFPDGFLWGTATASYQIEGAADEDGRGTSIWDTFSHTPGKVYRGDTGDVACDHYHWPLPQALEDRGGWTSRETSERFAEYTGIVYEALADSVSFWITLNEPWVVAWMGHAKGVHAPGHKDTTKALAATHHLLLGHGLALERMRSAGHAGDQLGITLSFSSVRPASDDPADVEAARRVGGNTNRLYLDPLFRGSYPEDKLDLYRAHSDFAFVREGDLEAISAPVDFLGVNYYYR